MTERTRINAMHPLFNELRNGLLWHSTGLDQFRQIQAERAITPNDGRSNRWGPKPYACQELCAVSLFDFTTESVDDVLKQEIKWNQFLGNFHPVTILLGLEESQLPGRIVRYPQNKFETKGNVIPAVEVCHCGRIPVATIASYLFVCCVDYSCFKKLSVVDHATLISIEQEFTEVVRVNLETRAAHSKRLLEHFKTPDVVLALREAKELIEFARKRT